MPKIEWREALKSGKKLSDKTTFDIRERATRMMADLLLICEKLPEKDRIMIFQNPRTHDTIMWPSLMKLNWEVADIPQSVKEVQKSVHSKETQELIKALELHGIKYDLERLFRDQDYLKAKRDQLRIRTET